MHNIIYNKAKTGINVANEKIADFLNEQVHKNEFQARAYVFDDYNRQRPKRDQFERLKSYLDNFLLGNADIRWVTLTGLRGCGKTTLFFQLYSEIKCRLGYKIFLSVDRIVQLLGSNLNEVLYEYERLLGVPLENLDEPLVLFLDEVQYDTNWGVALKSIYDRSRKVFIFATGSAALLMQQNFDVARRTIYEEIFPLGFCEYLKIKYANANYPKICNKLPINILFSASAHAVFEELSHLQTTINSSMLGINEFEFEQYLNFGSLPFMVSLKNEAIAYDQINKIIERIIIADIALIGNFSQDIVSKLPRLLYIASSMDVINFSKIATTFEISRVKIAEIFELFVSSGLLTKIVPYSSSFGQSKKPSKYLFAAPAFRAMYYKIAGSIISATNARGKLLEDLVGMYLTKLLDKKPAKFLSYDSTEGGADFVVGIGDRRIVIEVGSGTKSYRQVRKTAQKVGANYSLIISNDDLEYVEEFQTVKVPLKNFFLIA